MPKARLLLMRGVPYISPAQMTKLQASAPPTGSRTIFDRPLLILTLTAAFWGGNLVAGKLAVGHVGPYTLTMLRWLGALLCVLPFALPALKADWPVLKKSWPLLIFYGAVGYCGFNTLMYVAVHFTSGVNASIGQVTINIMVMIGNFLLFGLRVKRLQIVGAVLTIIGVMLIATHGEIDRLLRLDINGGDALVLLACLAYALYSIALRFRPKLEWMSFLVATFFGAALGAIGFQIGLGGGLAAFAAELPTISLFGWVIVLYVVTLPSIVAQLFYARGVQLIGANRASLFINLIPVFGTIGSVLVLGEHLEGFHLIAGALIIAGIVLAEWAARRQG